MAEPCCGKVCIYSPDGVRFVWTVVKQARRAGIDPIEAAGDLLGSRSNDGRSIAVGGNNSHRHLTRVLDVVGAVERVGSTNDLEAVAAALCPFSTL